MLRDIERLVGSMSIEIAGLILAFIGTVAGIIQAWLAWQQSREKTSPSVRSQSTSTQSLQSNTKARQKEAIPWSWLLGNLLMNVLVGFLLNAYLMSISSRIAVLIAIVAVMWLWARHWVEFDTEAENVALAAFAVGILIVAVIFNAVYKIPFLYAFPGAVLTYGTITAIPDKAKYELFQSLNKTYGFLVLVVVALTGLGAGWFTRGLFMQLR
jgi:hypothetical protein